MRKTLLLCLVLMSTFSYAQTLNIHFKNGTTLEFNKDLVEHVDFSEKPTPPTLTAGDAVDLGLSVKWASCNLGATKPEDYGNYYAWGETAPKDSYWKDTYSYFSKDSQTWINIGNDIAGTSYDAATVNLGGGWKMPTSGQMDELVNKCEWKWGEQNGIKGCFVSGNGNTIFLPAAGAIKVSSNTVIGEQLDYWTSSLSNYDDYAYDLWYYNGNIYSSSHGDKFWGFSIRPVISYDDADGTDYDDTPVTSNVSSYYAGGSIMSNNGTILSGSKLNFYFKNGSTETVTLTGIQLINGSTNAAGSNLLSSDVDVAAGESTGYTITIGASGIQNPICRFTYRYNKHTYTTEAKYQSYNFAKGKTTQLMAE